MLPWGAQVPSVQHSAEARGQQPPPQVVSVGPHSLGPPAHEVLSAAHPPPLQQTGVSDSQELPSPQQVDPAG